ncbi:MAG: family 20 glycosylhydrolase [Bacteroidales bacterium]
MFKIKYLVYCLIFLVSCKAENSSQKDLSIIPIPQQIQLGSGVFKFSSCMKIHLSDTILFDGIQQDMEDLLGGIVSFSMTENGTGAKILVQQDKTVGEEDYRLSIGSNQIKINAATKKGAYYALQTMRQMLPVEIESKPVRLSVLELPALTITDSPRFAYRGLMLDVSRYFIPKETVMKIIDAVSMIKINKLHLHLVDDQGWRIEIKKYPKLTETGAWRVFREEPFPLRMAPRSAEEPTPVGGFYTQDDIREMVAFAQKRHIEIIPEIEMPAHTVSSLASYPQYACPVAKEFIPVLPGMGGRNSKVVYCAGNDACFTFLQDIMDEVTALFPSEYIHIGGDEANKTYWEKCPLCQARMKQEGIDDEEDLQGYFMNRMAKYLQLKGKKVIGWDELTKSKIPEDVIIFGWQGMGAAGYKAAERGHQFVMTPSNTLYLDYYQGPQWFEPRGYFGNNTMKKIYDYEPILPNWDPAVAENLMGVQASMWCEFMNSPELVEYMVFPRVAALADIAWAQKNTKDWACFVSRLDSLQERWDRMGINYARSAMNLDHSSIAKNDTIYLTLSCQRPDVKIFYTIDGTLPDCNSLVYTDTLKLDKAMNIAAIAIKDEQNKGEVLNLNLEWNKATAKKILNENPQIHLLVNGLKGTDKHTDFEWCGWYGQDVHFTIDLGKETEVSKVELGQVLNYGVGVHLPQKVIMTITNENDVPVMTREKKYTMAEIYEAAIDRRQLVFDNLQTKGHYVHVQLQSPGKTPLFHHRSGQDTWIYVDEIMVN